MFSWRKKTVEVQLAGQRLKLDPLPGKLFGPFRDICARLATGVNPPVPPTWHQDLRSALSFVLLAAVEHDPKLDLSSLDRPTIEDSAEAIAQLYALTSKSSRRRPHG